VEASTLAEFLNAEGSPYSRAGCGHGRATDTGGLRKRAALELSPRFNTIEGVQPRTKRQKEVLDYVTRFIDRNGHKPSYQQIARHLGVSSRAGVQRHIAALESQGLISRRRENGHFGIELQMQKIVTEKVCGVELIEVTDKDGWFVESVRSVLIIPRYLIGEISPDEVFAFRVPDDAVIERHIMEDDIVLFQKRTFARRGEVVVARTRGEQLLLGLYFNHGGETEVRPANADHTPIILPADEIVVQGAMRGLMRFSTARPE
jgi:repressor LexA